MHIRTLIYHEDPLKIGEFRAEYLTVLPSSEILHAKLHQSIETARRRLLNGGDTE